jgi:hypothetical protein
MTTRRLVLTAATWIGLAGSLCQSVRADGVCTERPATAVERKAYGDAYALFQRVAPGAPEGWTATDQPADGRLPTLCQEIDGPIRRSFGRTFELERGRAERSEQAQQAYLTMMERQRAKAAANQAASADIDARINALTLEVQAAAAARKFDQIDSLSRQIEALTQQKMALTGASDLQAQADRIEADATRDTSAAFALYFEKSGNAADGAPYPTAAGRGRVSSYDDRGSPRHLVFIEFDGALERAVVRVEGDPARVRALVDASDLGSVAAFE